MVRRTPTAFWTNRTLSVTFVRRCALLNPLKFSVMFLVLCLLVPWTAAGRRHSGKNLRRSSPGNCSVARVGVIGLNAKGEPNVAIKKLVLITNRMGRASDQYRR